MTGNTHPAARSWAVERWGETGAPTVITKAAEGSSIVNDLDSTSTSGLLDRELFQSVREGAILFKLRGVRRTGWRVRSILTGGTISTWVREGTPIPVHKATFDNAGLLPHKIGAITVATEASLEAAPGIEAQLFSDLSRAVVDTLDRDFLDPTNSGVVGVTPPSITNGVSAIAATSDPAADLAALVEGFDGDLLGAFLIMPPSVAVKLAATGDFPDLGARGGETIGLPTLVSRSAPMEHVILVDPGGIMAAFDEQILLETGREGTLEMDTEPTNDAVTPTAANLTSLWMANSVGFRAIGHFAWAKARPGGVAMLQGGSSDWLDIAGVS
ncbi:phage major capsid protein [Sphingomonas sp. G124]|uniref:Phage major capsid protein n=1 Tax=Sphingomonas cremea TaxID=2904799 RepID=A0A9X1U4R3_9SPHN|nr:phage major capsid protein [Sphingomonas cremea]MCF2514436.1 phage major capsid protein [Sphingomonas cremea]